MLLKCPECQLQVSDKAAECPHCGYPMKPEAIKRKPRKKNNKRRSLPNGFGQISEIKNRNLRNPFRAMITVGKTETGRPICKPLKPVAYFPTYNDAYAALVAYNKNPYDLDSCMTAEELYEKWTNEYFNKISDSHQNTIKWSWKHCTELHHMLVIDIRARHIKGCIDNTPNPNLKNQIKSLWNAMLDYALEYELVDRNYARTFKLSEDIFKDIHNIRKEHIPFTDEEINILWSHIKDTPYVDMLLIQCYSGWRPQELCLLEIKNVDLENMTFTGGVKTKAGKKRLVPIHSRIAKLVENNYNKALDLNSDYLFNYINSGRHKSDIKFTHARYQTELTKICKKLGLNLEHRPHDGRVHFVTSAKKYDVDEYAIKYMVGHSISDITEKIYTKRETQWLKNEIEKIK